MASSADGTKLVASTWGGQIYTSIDAGLTWTARDSARFWQAVATSASGTQLVAVDQSPGQIYTSIASTSVGAAGSLTGHRYDAVELQYVGGGEFTVLSYDGALVVE